MWLNGFVNTHSAKCSRSAPPDHCSHQRPFVERRCESAPALRRDEPSWAADARRRPAHHAESRRTWAHSPAPARPSAGTRSATAGGHIDMPAGASPSAWARSMWLALRGRASCSDKDSFNANADSMRAAIAALGYTISGRPDARSIAVLGEMGELGDDAIEEHSRLGAELAKYDVHTLIVVGESVYGEAMAKAASQRGINTMVSRDIDDAI